MADAFISFQGEGPMIGHRAAFVRISGHRGSDIAAWLECQRVDLLVLTGDEPLRQQQALVELARSVGTSVRLLVETQGTITPAREVAELVDVFVVNVKLAHSGVARTARIVPEAIAALAVTGKAHWKFVARTISDLGEIADLVEEFALRPVWVVPYGTTPAAVLDGQRRLADAVLGRGWNLSTRLHILL
ncbi:7-carboxy-7-deazaguanine synthase QueE [Pseudonocardia sp. DSM 110487]|uniref:7-carboxy-7-deazaguanine synthase QueE n=1 Tax=Pseudonocardia sp. DSM 110487 TaxID=2865833 RepID=UPI001C699831|nr:7-carboxy-7-deazaguanine synthase QueE [Pseudonocardia sp. DSM 110487]QYN37817.1 7-carboxy-7-deazaguanine synthase QueE [Pseudonocardia sp. DSM 110487]